MQIVILAAGLGNRLGKITGDIPKALVPVAGRELIARAMDFTDHPSVDQRIVVTGYRSKKLESFLKEKYPKVATIHNPDFDKGNILTMKRAIPFIRDRFLLMNVDHIYPKRMFEHILESPEGITAVCDFDRSLGSDDMKVKLDDTRKLHKIKKTLDVFDCGYIGMTLCDKESLKRYIESFNAHLSNAGESSCVEHVLGWMAENNLQVNICDASGMPWLEVDDEKDLARAEEALRTNPDFLL
jgi:CDP-L-myo-inositol myo-inositolphosphotransferase